MAAPQFDREILIIALLLCAVAMAGVISVYRSKQDASVDILNLRQLALFGAATTAFSVIGSVVTKKEISLTLIVHVLTIRDVSPWAFRAVLPFAYAGLIVGCGGLIVSRFKRRPRAAVRETNSKNG
mgnify:CR=1 FL=1